MKSRNGKMHIRWAGFGVGAVAALALCLLLALLELSPRTQASVGAGTVALLMIVWWCTDALPMSLVACIPLLAWPLLRLTGHGFVADVELAAAPFYGAYSGLYLGGMTIGVAMESSGLHRRIALRVMQGIGASPRRLILGVLVATATVSAWISNTACTVMMLPIALALVEQIELSGGGRRLPHFGAAALLAVAYGANAGGIATKIGSATNAIAAGHFESVTGAPLGFALYSAAAVPLVLLILPLCWWLLLRSARHDAIEPAAAANSLRQQLSQLGPMRGLERSVAVVFCCACALWMSGDLLRPLLNTGFSWQLESRHYEASVSLCAALVLVLLRSVNWKIFRSMPFGALLLLGGSFAMAEGLKVSGATDAAADGFAVLLGVSSQLQVLVVAAGAVLMSALASNTATITLLVNVIPLKLPLLFTATFGASCDFMLPAGTPPNAIVYGTGRIPLTTMLSCGWKVDLLSIGVLWLYGSTVLQWFFA